MRSTRLSLFAATVALGATHVAAAQSAPPAPPAAATAVATAASKASPELKAFAAVYVAVSVVHDSVGAQLAQSRNKTPQAQKALQDSMRVQVAAVLRKAGLTDSAYQSRRFQISTDSSARRVFDAVVAQLTGAPPPGQVVAVATGPVVAVPAGPVGTHIGHVVNSFMDTPDKAGLLPMAMTEARVAQQHAVLGIRNPDNLDGLKLHAGHVINALNPTIVTAGPGKGYGVVRATTGIAAHIELAAKADGAGANVLLNAPRVATAARSTLARAEQIIKLAQQVQAATDAKSAAALMGEMVSLCGQLLAGTDANHDGKITWEGTEGGLQQALDAVTAALVPDKK